ncbi:MAG: 30S ribosomal protein S19e [Candidatus Bathyarchaeia archaeon]
MPTAYDVDANALVERLAKHLKENIGEIAPPTWALTSKTSAHRERPPQNPDWWYVRCASLLRKLYIHGPVGIQRLRVEYGGRKRKGTSIEHVKDSGGSAIREPLQQLEKAGLVAKEGLKGRKLSGEGVSLLNRVSGEILKGGSSGEGSKQ